MYTRTIVRHKRALYALLAAIPLGIASCGGGGGGSEPPPPPPTDTTKPTAGINTPTNNAIVSNVQIIEASASDNVAVSKVEFFIDNTLAFTDTQTPYSYDWDTTVLNNGPSTIMVKSTDSSGNVSDPAEISVTIDNSAPVDNPPSVAITSPDGTSDLSGSETISASATDDNGVASVEFLIGSTSLSVDTTAPYEVSWDTTSVADGNHTILARATDSIGQTDDDTVLVNVVNAVACVDKGNDGICDGDHNIPTVNELVAYPGAIRGDEVNGATVQLCAYADASVPFSLRVRYNPNVVGAFNTPDDITVALSDDGPGAGDRTANDNQYCGTITLNITEPVYYPYPTDTDGTVGLIKFIFVVFDENGIQLEFQDLANNFGIPLSPVVSIYVTEPSAIVSATSISSIASANSHVISVLNPSSAGCSRPMLQQMTSQVYGLFPTTPDPFDQFVMLKAGKSYRHANPQSISVRDDVDHNTRLNFDDSALYGSTGRLRAVGCMGNDIDLSAVLHEYAHPYARLAPYQTAYHYFQSDVDQVGPLSRNGGIISDGQDYFIQVNVNNSTQRNYLPYSKMTLRTMSLIDESEFGQVRYANRMLGASERIHVSETTLVDNALLNQQFGAMNPSFANSRKDHRAIIVVMADENGVVNDAYLSAVREFALYLEGNHVGELFNPIAYVSGLRTGSFSWTTGYRATMQLQIPPTN